MRQPWNMRNEKAQVTFAIGNIRVIFSGLQPAFTEMLGEALRKNNQKPIPTEK